MWTRTASQIPAGILSDRFGYKPVLVTSLLLLSVGTLAYGFATSFWMAVIARAATGLFHMVLPPAKALAGEICSISPTNSKTGMMVLSATIQLGGLTCTVTSHSRWQTHSHSGCHCRTLTLAVTAATSITVAPHTCAVLHLCIC